MESQGQYSPPVTPASFDKLPAELLFNVLQRLPAKELCRLRAVCRSWRSLLTSDAAFLMAHAQRYKEPIFLAKFRDDDTHVYVVDLSGKVVKRIAGAEGGLQVMRTRLNVACLASERNTCRVLNPATGGIHHVLPLVPANRLTLSNHYTFFSLGFVASTGEYKLLHQWWYRPFNPRGSGVQVLTINRGTDHAQQWRPRPGPPHSIDVCSDVVLDGVVYFLTSPDYILPQDPAISSMPPNHVRVIPRVPGDYIVSFDLAREEWRRDLHGPSSTSNLTSGKMMRHELTLADLNGSSSSAPPS